ncbi:hypothetical protein IT087_00895 [Candidatus Uhrbacteria bacterium]|nr:hypothetical protein [Candidatus Uhrbacteria bacterium]
MLIHLRAGGLKLDRKGHKGESLDDPPCKTGEDFSIEINGERDYRLTIGQRTETSHHRSYKWVFAKLEHLGRKRGRCWALLECMVATDGWRAQADKDTGGYTMKHPFAIYVFSVDHLAISPERFGSMPYRGNSDRLLGSMAKLFESGKI